MKRALPTLSLVAMWRQRGRCPVHHAGFSVRLVVALSQRLSLLYFHLVFFPAAEALRRNDVC